MLNYVQASKDASKLIEEQWKMEVADMHALLDVEITNSRTIMDAAAIEKGAAEER